MTSVYKKLFKYKILAVIHDTDSEFLGFFSLDKLTRVKIPTKKLCNHQPYTNGYYNRYHLLRFSILPVNNHLMTIKKLF